MAKGDRGKWAAIALSRGQAIEEALEIVEALAEQGQLADVDQDQYSHDDIEPVADLILRARGVREQCTTFGLGRE